MVEGEDEVDGVEVTGKLFDAVDDVVGTETFDIEGFVIGAV